jgi:hypothetical protein
MPADDSAPTSDSCPETGDADCPYCWGPETD